MKPWKVFITSIAERELKKLPKEAGDYVLHVFPGIVSQNPLVGEKLSGLLGWLRSFHFSANGKPYRVAYSIDSESHKIFIHYSGYRGGFYERLRRALGK